MRGHVELLWRRVENGRKKQKGRTLRVRPFSKTSAEFSGSAASSDMAHPLIVAGATTEHFGAQVGPGIDHGAGPYSRMAGLVKRPFCKTPAWRASIRSIFVAQEAYSTP
jgi:hypothetical protein